MPRKFHLPVHRKNKCRKQQRSTVNVEHIYTAQFTQSASHSILHFASSSILHSDTQSLGSQLSSQSTSQLSPASASPLVQHQFASQLSPASVYQSTSPLMQQSHMNFNLEKELKVSVLISILLDCKVPSLTKLQDRVDALSLLPHGMHLLDYLCF